MISVLNSKGVTLLIRLNKWTYGLLLWFFIVSVFSINVTMDAYMHTNTLAVEVEEGFSLKLSDESSKNIPLFFQSHAMEMKFILLAVTMLFIHRQKNLTLHLKCMLHAVFYQSSYLSNKHLSSIYI